jgi:recombination protein RecA
VSSRYRRLDAVVNRLQLQHGARAIRRASASEVQTLTPCLSTAFPALDAALADARGKGDVGGVPRGRITEIIGPATSGKVTLAAKILAIAHGERNALAAWLDPSRTCDPDYLHRCGVDLDRLLIVRPQERDDALLIALHLVESHALSALVIDGCFDPEAGSAKEAAGTMERLATAVASTMTAILFLSEPAAQYQTLAHAATLRLAISRERWLIQREDVRGYEGHVTILKNKLGRAGVAVPIRITFNGTVRVDGL